MNAEKKNSSMESETVNISVICFVRKAERVSCCANLKIIIIMNEYCNKHLNCHE